MQARDLHKLEILLANLTEMLRRFDQLTAKQYNDFFVLIENAKLMIRATENKADYQKRLAGIIKTSDERYTTIMFANGRRNSPFQKWQEDEKSNATSTALNAALNVAFLPVVAGAEIGANATSGDHLPFVTGFFGGVLGSPFMLITAPIGILIAGVGYPVGKAIDTFNGRGGNLSVLENKEEDLKKAHNIQQRKDAMERSRVYVESLESKQQAQEAAARLDDMLNQSTDEDIYEEQRPHSPRV